MDTKQELFASNATLTVFTKGEVAELARAGTLEHLPFEEWRGKTWAARADPSCMPTFEERCKAAQAAGFRGFSVSHN